MNLKTRISLLLSTFLLIILTIFHILTYYFVIKITTDSEINLMWNKISTILHEEPIRDTSQWSNPKLLMDYLTSNELIRIISPESTILYELSASQELSQRKSVYHPYQYSDIVNSNDRLMIIMQAPIYDQNGQVMLGSLEIGRNLVVLKEYLSTLMSVLIYSSIGVVLVSLVGGLIYTRIVFRPLHRLAETMSSIRRSGRFRKIKISGNWKSDEITQLVVNFNEMIERLENTFNTQKRFIADASHELKTPLMIIESYANMLIRWADAEPHLRMEATRAIRAETARLKNLTQSLLTLMVEEEAEQLIVDEFDFCGLITETLTTMRQAFKRDLYLCTAFAQMNCVGDRSRLKQLLIILIDNALKYSSDPIHVELVHSEGLIHLAVVDYGIGIEQEEIPHLFDRFYRADKSRSRKKGGAGLGLSIAQNIVRLHRGTIHIESNVGKGTRVTVSLPSQ